MRCAVLLFSLLIAACATSPSAPTHVSAAASVGAPSQAIFEQLKSEDAAESRNALAAVEANPGAYLPSIFGGVARELLEAGRTEEALAWDRFGMLRMMEDIEFAGRISDRANHMGLMLMMSYQTDEGEALTARMQAFTPDEHRAAMARADALDARYPRRYSPTWVLTGRASYEQNFVAEPVVWTSEDLAALAEVHARVRAEFDAPAGR